jgi:hypothetical protein
MLTIPVKELGERLAAKGIGLREPPMLLPSRAPGSKPLLATGRCGL